MKLNNLFFLVITLKLAVACQTTHSNQQRGRPTIPPEHGIAERDLLDSEIPHALWSPEKRRLNASYYALVGEYELLNNRLQKSKELFEYAYGLDANVTLALKMIFTKAKAGDFGQAVEQARKMVLLYPKNPELNCLYGQLLLGGGASQKAVPYFERAILLAPGSVEAYISLIQLYQDQKELTKAIVIAEDLVLKNPAYPEGWSTLAKLFIMTGQKARALPPAARAYDLRSNDPEKVLIYALTLEINGKSREAVQLYETLFRLNPTNEELIGKMVELYRQLGDLNNALTLLQDAEKNFGEAGPGVKLQRAFLLWELKKYSQAAKIFDELAVKYPDSDRVLYLAALGRERLEKWDKALEAYHAIPNSSPYKIHADYRSIKVLATLKRYDEAMLLVKKAVTNNPERREDFFSIGAQVLEEQERLPDAITFIREGLRNNEKSVELLFLLGVYQEKNNDISSCIANMREVIKVDPTFHSAYNCLGYLFAERGENLDEAEQLVKRALELKPNDGFYLDSLAWIYFKKNRLQEAYKLLTEASRITPEEGVIWEHFGDIYRAWKEENKAKDAYQMALQKQLESKDRARIQKKAERTPALMDEVSFNADEYEYARFFFYAVAIGSFLGNYGCQTVPQHEPVELPANILDIFDRCDYGGANAALTYETKSEVINNINLEWRFKEQTKSWVGEVYTPIGKTLINFELHRESGTLKKGGELAYLTDGISIDRNRYFEIAGHWVGLRVDEAFCLLKFKLPEHWVRSAYWYKKEGDKATLKISDPQRKIDLYLSGLMGRGATRRACVDLTWDRFMGLWSEKLEICVNFDDLKKGNVTVPDGSFFRWVDNEP